MDGGEIGLLHHPKMSQALLTLFLSVFSNFSSKKSNKMHYMRSKTRPGKYLFPTKIGIRAISSILNQCSVRSWMELGAEGAVYSVNKLQIWQKLILIVYSFPKQRSRCFRQQISYLCAFDAGQGRQQAQDNLLGAFEYFRIGSQISKKTSGFSVYSFRDCSKCYFFNEENKP